MENNTNLKRVSALLIAATIIALIVHLVGLDIFNKRVLTVHDNDSNSASYMEIDARKDSTKSASPRPNRKPRRKASSWPMCPASSKSRFTVWSPSASASRGKAAKSTPAHEPASCATWATTPLATCDTFPKVNNR